MTDFKDVLSELDALVKKITSGERSRSNFTSMLDEQLSSISSSLSLLEQVDAKLSSMIAGFVRKLKACNDDLAAEKIQKNEYAAEKDALRAEIEMMRMNAEIASAATEDERRKLIAEHERTLTSLTAEANQSIQELEAESAQLESEKRQLELQLSNEQQKLEEITSAAQQEIAEGEEKLAKLQINMGTLRSNLMDEREATTQARQLAAEAEDEKRVALKAKEDANMRVSKLREQLAKVKEELTEAAIEKKSLTAQITTNEEQIQQLNEVSAMTQEDLETFKAKNKQDLTSAKEQMDTLDKKIKELESELEEKNKTLTDGVEAIRRIIGMLQQFVSDDDSAGTSITSKNEEIRDKIKKQMDVIHEIEKKLDSGGVEEATTELMENPLPSSSEQQQEEMTVIPSRQSTRKNKSQRKVTNVGALGDIGDDPNISGGTRKRKRHHSRKTRRNTKRRNQKKRKTTRRKRRKQRGGYTYKTSV